MADCFQVRDPVHNFVKLREKEVKLINTFLFQRLRGIRQLAMANLVYPGALHTRFDHSLGVVHVAGLMAEELGLHTDEIELVRLSALLHDLGHGPFSHVSEHILDRYADRNTLPPDQKKEKIHEVITCHLIRTNRDIVHILGQSACDDIANLLAEGQGQQALRSLVSGPLDADKQDYLLRDSFFCGVPYGLFDIHQLHRSITLAGPQDNKELMINSDGVHAVEQYVLAKYYLTTNVYRHKVRLITDQMIIRAIDLGIECDDIKELNKAYRFDNSNTFFTNYTKWDDARFLLKFAAPKKRHETLCGQLLNRLQHRHLLKRVFSERIPSLHSQEAKDKLLALDRAENSRRKKSLERVIAQTIQEQVGSDVDPRFVILHSFNIKSVRATSRNDEAGILIDQKPQPRFFEDESTLFKSINEMYSDAYVEVYAPVTWNNRAERSKIRGALREPMRELIEDEFKVKLKEPKDGHV